MSLRLDMDHHVDAAITRGLQRRGIDVVTSSDDGTSTWDDERLLARATEHGRFLFTQDDDHPAIAHRRLRSGRDFAGLIFAYPLDVTIGQAIRHPELIAVAFDEADVRNRVEFLPLRGSPRRPLPPRVAQTPLAVSGPPESDCPPSGSPPPTISLVG